MGFIVQDIPRATRLDYLPRSVESCSAAVYALSSFSSFDTPQGSIWQHSAPNSTLSTSYDIVRR